MRTKEEVIKEVEHLTEIHSTLKEIDEVYFETLVQEAKQYKLWDELVDVYCNWSNILFNYYGDFDKAKEVLDSCANIALKKTRKEKMARYYNVIANLNRMNYKFPEAINYFKRAERLIREVNLNGKNKSTLKLEFYVQYSIYCVYSQVKELSKAWYYLLKAEKIVNQIGDIRLEIKINVSKANIYWKEGKYDKMLETIEPTIIKCRRLKLNYELALSLYYLANFYFNKESFRKTIKILKESYKLAINEFPNLQFLEMITKISSCYLKLNRIKDAIHFAELAESKIHLGINKDHQIGILGQLCDIYTALKNYEKVVKLKEIESKISHSNNIIERTKLITEIESKFKLALKQKELNLQQKKQKEMSLILQAESSNAKQIQDIVGSLQKSLKKPVHQMKVLFELLQHKEMNDDERKAIFQELNKYFDRLEHFNQALSDGLTSNRMAVKDEKLQSEQILSLLHRQLMGQSQEEVLSKSEYPKTHFIKQYISELANGNEAYAGSRFKTGANVQGIMM